MKLEGGGHEGLRSPSGGSFENWPERGSSKDEHLSSEEALLYQEYATKIEGREFSEQADEQAYKEAENLIEKLKGGGLDWVGIEWDKIDLKDIHQIREAQERLDTAARLVLESRAKDGTKEENQKWKSVLNATKGVLLPFVAAMGILAGCSSAEKTGAVNQLTGSGGFGSETMVDERSNEPKYIEARVEVGGSVADFRETVEDWLDRSTREDDKGVDRMLADEGTDFGDFGGPERRVIHNPIQSIIIDSVDYAEDYKKGESVASARVIIITKNFEDGTDFTGPEVHVLKGSYSVDNGGIKEEPENSDQTPYAKWKNPSASGFVEIAAKEKAIINALESFRLKFIKSELAKQ